MIGPTPSDLITRDQRFKCPKHIFHQMWTLVDIHQDSISRNTYQASNDILNADFAGSGFLWPTPKPSMETQRPAPAIALLGLGEVVAAQDLLEVRDASGPPVAYGPKGPTNSWT